MPAVFPMSPGFHPLWLVVVVTILFTVLARVLRGVSSSGAIAGAVICFVLYSSAGAGAFILLTLLFVLTWATTRLGYQRKQRLGIAEKKEGRTAAQVFANVGAAAACAAAYRWQDNPVYLLAMCAALSEAAVDTVSSEIGQTMGSEARLITNWRRVPAGTNGGISIAGTLAGIAAALLMSATGVALGVIARHELLPSVVASTLGMICDSYLGATLEHRKLLHNNGVNFLGTLTSVGVVAIWQTL